MPRYNPYGLSEHLKQGMCYIYALCEPGTLEVRYVGKAEISVLDRWQGHMGAARRGVENPVSRWIAEWQKAGKEPTPIMLTECPNNMKRQVERAWVELFVDNGYNLLNVQLNSVQRPKQRDITDGFRWRWVEAFGPSSIRYLNNGDDNNAS